MRVVIDGRKIADYGIGTYIRGLLAGLLELGGSDEYLVLAPESARKLIPFEHVVFDAPKYSLRELFAVGRAVRALKADVFHAPHYVVPVTDTPTVVTIHDLIHLRLRNPVKRAYARTMMRRALRHHVITVSHAVADDIQATFGGDAPAVAPNGIDARFTPDGPRAPGRYVLYAGNDKPHKNVETLVAACERAHEPLILAGAPFERFRGRATLAGHTTDDELAALYRGAIALVMPSLDEGFGLPAAEAMACGTAVITSNAPALVEVTADAALHVDARDVGGFADAIARVASDAALREQLARRGVERATNFTWPKCAELTRAAYRTAANAR
jgi:glycosyltransferase involved in cell wall biosynthesis